MNELGENKANLINKFNRSLSLLCWAYNEEDLIEEYLEKATKLMDASVKDYEIIEIDNQCAAGQYGDGNG